MNRALLVERLQRLRDTLVEGDGRNVLNEAIAQLLPDTAAVEQGALAMHVGVDERRRVRLSWDRPLEFLSFGPKQARHVAAALVANATQAEQGDDRGEGTKQDEQGADAQRNAEARRELEGLRGEGQARILEGEFKAAERSRPDALQPAGDSAPAEGARGRGALGGAAAGADGP